jgi:uncharacterized protein YlxW (UPF0749 family)
MLFGLFGTARSSEESDDEDDDEMELQAELQRIKEEREQAQARKLQEEQELEQRQHRQSAVKNDPLALIEENSSKVHTTVAALGCTFFDRHSVLAFSCFIVYRFFCLLYICFSPDKKAME